MLFHSLSSYSVLGTAHLTLTTSLGDAFIIHVVQMRKPRWGELQHLPRGHKTPDCQSKDSDQPVWLQGQKPDSTALRALVSILAGYQDLEPMAGFYREGNRLRVRLLAQGHQLNGRARSRTDVRLWSLSL